MIFSEIVSDIDFWVHTNSSSYPIADKTRGANEWLRVVNSTAWGVSNEWEVDDTNQTDLPIATANLVAGQADYALPSAIQRLMGVSVKDESGDWHKLHDIDQIDVGIDLAEFRETDGRPEYYDVIGQSIMLYPAPAAASITATAGLKVRLSRGVDIFVVTDTTKEPGFHENFHRILSIGTAYDYAVANNMTERINDLRNRLTELTEGLQSFYGHRQRGKTVRIKVKPINVI